MNSSIMVRLNGSASINNFCASLITTSHSSSAIRAKIRSFRQCLPSIGILSPQSVFNNGLYACLADPYASVSISSIVAFHKPLVKRVDGLLFHHDLWFEYQIFSVGIRHKYQLTQLLKPKYAAFPDMCEGLPFQYHDQNTKHHENDSLTSRKLAETLTR
nr:hypothetical protein L203_05898 [Cryptococcus depauperatus CBS 7841]